MTIQWPQTNKNRRLAGDSWGWFHYSSLGPFYPPHSAAESNIHTMGPMSTPPLHTVHTRAPCGSTPSYTGYVVSSDYRSNMSDSMRA